MSEQATISFYPPVYTGGDPIINYTVTAMPGNITATGPTSPIVVTGLTDGVTYTFTVTANNAVGPSAPSSPSNPVTPSTIPSAPYNVEALPQNAAAQVFFLTPFNGGSAITSYTAVASPGGQTVSGSGSPLVVSGLTNGTTYTVTVTAENVNGSGPSSAPSNTVTPSAIPAAPTIGTATAYFGYATVSFTPGSDSGSPITQFTATASPGGLFGTSLSSPITINGLTNGVTYTFEMTATNANGTSPVSAPSNPVTPSLPTTVPGAPTAVVASPQNAAALVAFTAPANGGAPITGYTVTSNPWSFTGTGAGSPISVTGLTNGTPYTFSVTATNAIGIGPASSNSAPVTPSTVPAAPTGISAGAGILSATVSFNAGDSGGSPITQYTATASPGGNTATGMTSPLTITGLIAETSYTLSVTATNANGTGPASPPSSAVTPYGIPGAPTGVTATGGAGQALVSFSAPADNGGSAIINYLVNSSRGGLPTLGTSSPIAVSGLTNGLAYTFTVQAKNAAGTGPTSGASNSVTPSTIPSAPTSVAAAGGNAQAVVSFSAPATGGSPITGYVVTSSPGGFTASGAASPLTVTGLTNGTAYTFTVVASNANGAGPASTPSAPVSPSADAPSAPVSPSASAGNAQAIVTFSPPTNTGGSPITAYTAKSTPGSLTATGAASPLTVSGLINGTAYTFTVTATNSAGTGPASVATASVTPSGVPSAPTALAATPGNGQVSVAFTAANGNGSAVTGYTMTASPGGATATGTGSPLVVSGLTNGTAYSFTATATNGNGTSAPSAPSNTVTPATVPGAPSGVTATPGNAQATVTFTAPTSTGGSPITSYIVTSSGGQSASGTASPITVTSLTNGTSYTFTVKAVNSIGSSAASAPSVAVTPSAPAGFVITTSALPSGTAGTAYSGSVAATGGVTPYTYANTTALPAGIALNAATGALSGTPTVAGTTTVSFQATDSSGTPTYPASTNAANNDGPGQVQTPQGIPIPASGSVTTTKGPIIALTTVATYGSTSAPPHNGVGLSDTLGDSFTALSTYAGPYNGEFGAGPSYINASQELVLWSCASPKGGSTNFQQWFGTAGYGGANSGDSDYQAGRINQYPLGSTIIGYCAINAQFGNSNYTGVPQGTALVSGSITITAAQVPCRLFGFCFNLSQNGTGWLATPNAISGIPGFTIENMWAFNSSYGNTCCYAYWNITTAGTYTPSFNQPSSTPNCYFTTGWAVQGPDTGDQVTPVKSIPITIAGGGSVNSTIARSATLNQLVNGANAVIQARGANFSGLEDSTAQGNQPWYGSAPNWSYWQTWKPNFLRIPLNAAAFLGLSCRQISSGGNSWATTATSADPFGNYVAAVDTAIRNAQAVGCYVILDLHWSAPQFTFSGATAYAMPLWQPAFMNSATDLSFWQAIATRYGTQATPQTGISNSGIVFDLFNEPYLDQVNGGSNASTTWNLMKNGGTQTSFPTNGATTAVAQSWTVLGYQQALNAIRTIGAHNVIMMGGCGYANACSGYATFMATDSLSPPQTAVSIHLYQAGSTGYPQTYPDTGSGTSSWSTPLKAVLAAGIPVICGESGGTYGPSAANPDPYVAYVTGQADSLGFSYIGWEAWAPVSPTSSGTNNLFTTSNTPTNGQGTTLYNWLVNHANPVTVPGAPSGLSATAGNAQATISFTAPSSNGGAAITNYTVTSNPGSKTGTGSASPVTVTGLTNGTAYTFTATATNSVGTGASSSASNSVTPAASGGGSAPTQVQLLLQGQTSQNLATDAGGNNRFQPQNANYTMIGWLSVSGATSYNIYRATIPVGSQATGTLNYGSSPYATVTAAAAASAYSGYVSGSGSAPYQTAVNCAYGDTAANGCVNGTRGGGAGSAPTAGDLWAATGYSYKVSAVVGGVETALSAPHYAVYIENGLQILQLNSFNNQPAVLNSTAAGTDPLGNTKSIVWTSSASPYWNPYCGNGATEWNLNIRPFNYVEMYIKAAQNDSGSLTNAFENEGDNYINGGAGVNFSTYSTPSGNLQSGVWTLIRQPISVLFTDSTRGRQNAFYKCIPSVNGMSGTWYIGAWRFVT